MAGIIGLRAEDMDQVDALKRARPLFPNGLPMVRPSVRALVLVHGADGLEAVPARFGFSKRFSSINARADKLAMSPLWRRFFGKHHGIAPLSYVIEWKVEKGAKQPYLIQRRGGGLLMAPALVGPSLDDKTEQAFAICTREPNRFFSHFHDRMVGICDEKLMKRWLEPEGTSGEDLLECIAAPEDDELEAVPTDPGITARRAGDWSPLPAKGTPVRWHDIKAEIGV